MHELNNLADILPNDAGGDRIAFVDLRIPHEPRAWTAQQMGDTANAVARGLLARGFRSGDRIAILSENRAEFMQAYIGIARAGMTAVPVNFRLPRDTITHIFRDADVRAAIADRERVELCPDSAIRFDMDGADGQGWRDLLDPGPRPSLVIGSKDMAKILYTSGSSGLPKGVALSHGGQAWTVKTLLPLFAPIPQDSTLIVAPTYHKNGLIFSTVCLAGGCTIYSMPRFEARGYLEAVAKHRCSYLSGVPTMFALLARERDLLERLDLTNVRLVTMGSAPVTEALIEKICAIFPNAVVTNSYGTTEAGPCVFGPHPQGLERPALSLGYPLPDIQWRLIDGPTPDEGVFCMKTPALMSGYVNRPDALAERVREGWYNTGDIMRRGENGFFFFVGRADDMIVCGGENIYPGEVEKLLEQHPAIAQAAVVPVADEIKGEVPVAFVVTVPGADLSEDDIKRFSLSRGPAYSHPRIVVFKESLPIAGTHKVDRKALLAESREIAVARGRSTQ
jgi:acyl-CoA synthetase (AMP-forming)/AMP-acid ligase II